MSDGRDRLVHGVVCGVLATVVFTWTSARLKRYTGTHDSVQPVQVAAALAGGGRGADRGLANTVLHWAYGTWGGLLRVLLARRGVRGWRLDLAHLAAFWLPWRVLALAHRPEHRPPRRDRTRSLAADLGKHVVYVLAARAVHGRLGHRDAGRVRGGEQGP